MKQLIIKPEKCIGCRTCELICSFEHYGQINPRMANVTVFEYEKASVAIPIMCLQCENPACEKVCPVKAIRREENGAVTIHYEKCIGCKMCMNACPLGNIAYHPALRKVYKCDLCGGDPQCAKFCPGGAITFDEVCTTDVRKKQAGDRYRDVLGEEAQA